MSADPTPNHPEWKAEQTNPELAVVLQDGLQEITDPEIGLSIIQLGLVRDVEINENNAVITMILTTPYCPYGPALIESTRRKAETVLKRPTTINFSMEMWDLSMMEDGLAADWGLY